MPILIGILIGLFAVVIINEVITLSVFGRLISTQKLNEFFEKNLQDYQDEFLTGERPNRMFYGIAVGNRELRLPFIAKVPMGTFTKWYIQGKGQIPRWSKWSKELDKIWETKN